MISYDPQCVHCHGTGNIKGHSTPVSFIEGEVVCVCAKIINNDDEDGEEKPTSIDYLQRNSQGFRGALGAYRRHGASA